METLRSSPAETFYPCGFNLEPILWEENYRQRVREELEKLAYDSRSSRYLLPRTGFNMVAQVSGWVETYINGLKNFSRNETIIDEVIERTAEDIRGYYFEAQARSVVLEIRNLQRKSGRLVFTSYGLEGRLMADVVIPDERDGAVKEAFVQLEKNIESAGPGTVVFITSPPGWSGISDPYQETQTYVYRINGNNELEAITIRSDLTLEENRRLLQTFGIEIDGWSEKTSVNNRIKSITATVALFKETGDDNGFIRVADAIRRVKKEPEYAINRPAENGKKGEAVPFEDVYQQINELPRLRSEIVQLIADYKQQVRNNIYDLSAEAISGLVILTGGIILEIEKARNRKESITLPMIQTIEAFLSRSNDYYREELNNLQSVSTCAGGGSSVSTSFGSRWVSSEDKEKLASGEYGFCCGMAVKKGDCCPVCGLVVN